MAHINTIVPETPRSTRIFIPPQQIHRNYFALHTALSHLDKRNTYVRMLFIDYSSTFHTIEPSKLINKLRTLELNTSLCNWILDFLTGCPQVERVGTTR
jgi:hypothetical protein